MEEKVEVNGEGEDVVFVRVESVDVDVKVVAKGVSPRREEAPGAGGPQADCCPLTGRTPEF